MRSLTRGGGHVTRAAGHPNPADVLDAIASIEGINGITSNTVVRDRAARLGDPTSLKLTPRNRTVTRARRG